MKLFFLSFAFFYSTSQRLIWNTTFNETERLPWDYYNGNLFYYSNSLEYRCKVSSRSCQIVRPNYRHSLYVLAKSDFYLLVEENTYMDFLFLQRYGYSSGIDIVTLLNNPGKIYPMSFNEKYFYVNRPSLLMTNIILVDWENPRFTDKVKGINVLPYGDTP
jgi:hypothetical protein